MNVLPKNRGKQPGGRVSLIHDLSHKGRVILGRTASRRVGLNRGRGDMFARQEDTLFEDAIHFHENKHTILLNFEEWIKLSTDNKITLKNSWLFALIDYFHDLNVIKDGDNINFQRASATLDGCVKIYLSRVESVASETGKLLSGLATKKEDMVVEEEDDDAEEADTLRSDDKKKRRVNRVLESTLVGFDAIRIKKLEQELAIDPLFKKALAEFDEGGAKSLLLNTLSIDASGRVVFDATTQRLDLREEVVVRQLDAPVNIALLLRFLYDDPDELDDQVICPSLGELHEVLKDVNKAKSVLGDVNQKFLDDDREPIEAPDDFNLADNDFGDAAFAESNHASEVASLINGDDGHDAQVHRTQVLDQDLMAYFDEKLLVNWRGPEYWKVTNLRQKIDKETTPRAEPRPRRTDTSIDFLLSGDIDEDVLFKKPAKTTTIERKPDEREFAHHHLLPEDIKYNSTRLCNLFFKPDFSVMTLSKQSTDTVADEAFFAQQYQENEKRHHELLAASFQQAEYEDYDNDGFGGIDFNDALAPADDVKPEDGIGSQLITGGRKVRPDHLNFSRVAKRVDIRQLKDNIWGSIKEEQQQPEEKKFAEVVGSIGKLYAPEERKDLSTSFCFICLLHLANEHGLLIENTESHDDLRIKF